MKKTNLRFLHFAFFLFSVLTLPVGGSAQNRKIDSLKRLLATTKSDTAAAKHLGRLAFRFEEEKEDDSAMKYASKGYALAKKTDFLLGMWLNLAEQCVVYQRHGNYQKALSLYLDFLKLCEEKKDIQVTTRLLNFISDLYLKLEDYNLAVTYAKKNTQVIIDSKVGGGWLTSNLYTIGIAYIYLHQADSALVYFQRGFALASQGKGINNGKLLIGLGMANRQLGNYEIALAYFDNAIKTEEVYKDEDIYFAYLQKAELLNNMNKADSSVFYYEKALHTVSGNFNDQLRILKALANTYAAKDPGRAIKYFSEEQKLRDSLFTTEKLNAIHAMTYNEEERQKELANLQKEEAEDHKKNIENISILIGIISFLVVFLLLSRSIIVNEKWISFLGVVGLLILFEFINLLLHPLLERLTHHSSVFMLLIMVGIAALLVPLHHKIEKWVTDKMVEKNKRIRIAAAKRTIEKLEEKPGPS